MKRLLFLVLLVYSSLNVFAQVPQAPTIFKIDYFVGVTLAHVKSAEYYRVDIAYDSLFKTMLPGLENFGGQGNYLTNDPYFCNPQQRNKPISIQSLFSTQYFDYSQLFFLDIPRRGAVYLRMRAVNSTGASLNSNTVFFPLPKGFGQYYTVTARRSSSSLAYIPASELKPNTTYKLSVYRSSLENSYDGSFSACFAEIQDPYRTSIEIQAQPEIVKTITKQDTTFSLQGGNHWYALVLKEQNTGDTLPYYTILPSLSPSLNDAVQSVELTSIFKIRDDFQHLSDSSILYAFRISVPFSLDADTTITQRTIDSVLTAMIRLGIPLEQVWFQEGRVVCNCRNHTDTPDLPVAIYFAVKLSRPDDRIKNFGDWQRVTKIPWANSPASVPRKYVFRQTMVSVQDAGSAEFSCSLAPNPSGEQVSIRYTLPEAATVHVEVLDVLGQTIVRHEGEYQAMGEHNRSLALQNLPNGVYFLRLHCFSSNGRAIQKTITFTHF